MSNDKKDPTIFEYAAVLLAVLFIIFIIVQIFIGTFHFLAYGGWKWLAVVGGFLLFIILIMPNKK